MKKREFPVLPDAARGRGFLVVQHAPRIDAESRLSEGLYRPLLLGTITATARMITSSKDPVQ